MSNFVGWILGTLTKFTVNKNKNGEQDNNCKKQKRYVHNESQRQSKATIRQE